MNDHTSSGSRPMKRYVLGACVMGLSWVPWVAAAPPPPGAPGSPPSPADKPEPHRFEPFKPEAVSSNGSVTVDGKSITYQAIAGTLVVHPKDWDDVPRDPATDKPGPDDGEGKNPTAEASMFYVAYFKDGGKDTAGKGSRPVTF